MATVVVHVASFHLMTFDLPRNVQLGSKSEELYLLPDDFQPGEFDVICQRGKECFQHEGNVRFRATIERNLPAYESGTRHEKSRVVCDIVKSVREDSVKRSHGGSTGFVRKDLLTRRWYNVDDKIARDKCSQAMRDLIKSRRGNVTKKRSATFHLPSHQDEQSGSEDDSSLGSKRLCRDTLWSSSPVMATAKTNGVVPQGYTSCYHMQSLGRPFSPAAPEERLFTPDTHPFLPETHLSSMDSTVTVQTTQNLSGDGSHIQTNTHQPIPVATFQNQLSADLEPTPISDNLHHRSMPPIIQREDSTIDLLRHIVPTSLVPIASVPQRAVANLPQSTPRTAQWQEQSMLPTVIGTDHFFRFTGRTVHDPPPQPQHNYLPYLTKSSPEMDGGQKPAATMGKGHK